MRARSRPSSASRVSVVPELWTPGMAGPLEDLVNRIHRRIEAFASEHGLEQAMVEVELATARCCGWSRSPPSPATAS